MVAKTVHSILRTATPLSRSLAILIAALGSTARAEEAAQPSAPEPPVVAQPAPADAPPTVGSEVSQPAPAFPPPPPFYATEPAQPTPWYPPPPPSVAAPVRPLRPPRPPGPNGFDRRHRVGGQLGGTGIFQIVYRYRAAGSLHLEVGAAGIHGANVSVGAVVGTPYANRWFPYLGFGGGFMFGGGPPNEGCDPGAATCPHKSDSFPFLHARVGIGVGFGATRRNLVSLDVGGWYGKHYKSETDAAGVTTESSEMIALPMAGLSYFFAVH